MNKRLFKPSLALLLAVLLLLGSTPNVFARQPVGESSMRQIINLETAEDAINYMDEDWTSLGIDIYDFNAMEGTLGRAVIPQGLEYGIDMADLAMELAIEVDYSIEVFDSEPLRNPSTIMDLDIIVDVEQVDAISAFPADHLLNNDEPQGRFGIEPFNTNPNLAIYIPSALFGLELQDLANHQDRWYTFSVPANRKIQIVLSHQGGDYDLLLFRLDGFSLILVDVAATANPFERISYISSTGGTYFLAVSPFIPAPVPHLFTFVIDVISGFDANEANDFPHQATQMANHLDVRGNIDNRFDEDWFRLNVTTGGNRDVAVFNALAGHYAVFVLDGNLNIIGSFMADGGIRRMNFPAGTFYFRIVSLTGHRDATEYRFIVTNANHRLYNHNGQILIARPGEVVHEAGGNLFALSLNNGQRLTINGVEAQINGRYRYVNLNPHLPTRYLREVSFWNNSLEPYYARGLRPFQVNHSNYRGWVVGVDILDGHLHRFDNRFWPMSWFFTTQPRWGADNNSAVGWITVHVSLNTGRVIEARPENRRVATGEVWG